jgi:hypothetical protein
MRITVKRQISLEIWEFPERKGKPLKGFLTDVWFYSHFIATVGQGAS